LHKQTYENASQEHRRAGAGAGWAGSQSVYHQSRLPTITLSPATLSDGYWRSSYESYWVISVAEWTLTGPLSSGHDFLTATLLPNGKVLIAGNMFAATQTCMIQTPERGR